MRKRDYLLLLIVAAIMLIVYINHQFQADHNNNVVEIAPYPEKVVEIVSLYFGGEDNEYLVREGRAIERTFETREELIIKKLINGPVSNTLRRTIPRQVKVYFITTVDGVCYVNFSRDIITNFVGGEKQEATLIYSIVNSLTELDYIDKVQILVEGERLDIFNKYVSLKEPYSRNERIINNPFLSPIEAVVTYLKLIEEEEYRRAYDFIYRPNEQNFDYSMFYRYMRQNKENIENITVKNYSYKKYSHEIVLHVTYEEQRGDGTIKRYENEEFHLVNDFGEWKIIFHEI